MNSKKKILVIVLGIVFLIGALLFVYFHNNTKNLSDEYTKLDKDNVFVYKNSEEIIKVLENGTGIVFLGFPECPWCQAYVPILNEVAKEEGIDKIYYYNIKNDRKNNTDVYKKIVSILGDNLKYDEDGNRRIYVPNVTFVLNGKIIGNDNETSVIEEDITPEKYWTSDKKSTLKEKLRTYILQITDSLCTSCDE